MPEIKKQNNTCSHPDCTRDKFENSEECILHCEKEDWFVIDKDGKKDWSRSKDNINKFWEDIRSFLLVEKNVISFDYFIFPIFESTYKCVNVKETKDENEKTLFYLFKNNANFWREGEPLKFDKDLIFSNCVFYDSIDFKYIEFKSLYIILNSQISGSVIFNESKISGELLIDKTSISGCFNTIASKFNNIHIQNANIYQIVIDFSLIKFFIRINNSNIDTIKIGKISKFNILKMQQIEIYELMISDSTQCSDYLQFEDVTVNKLNFSTFDVFHCNTIFFKTCTLDNFTIQRLIGTPKFITFSDIAINENLTIKDSNLSNFEFHNFDISKSKKKFINVSYLSNNGYTIFNGVKWGDIKETFDTTTDRDTYRQFKIVNEKQGNIIEANKFYSAEMEAYKKEITAKGSKTPCREKIIFWMNYLVSDFGRNWLKPLRWFFLTGFIAFVFSNFCKIISYFKETSEINLTILWNAINQFFEYLNPFNTSPIGNPIIWFGFKVLSVFFIYQFIISLRRQTRR